MSKKKPITKKQFFKKAEAIRDGVYVVINKHADVPRRAMEEGKASKPRAGIVTTNNDTGDPMIGVKRRDQGGYIPFILCPRKRRGRPNKVAIGEERPITILVAIGANGTIVKGCRGKWRQKAVCLDDRIAKLLIDLTTGDSARLADKKRKDFSRELGAKLTKQLRELLYQCFPRSPDARLTIKQAIHQRKCQDTPDAKPYWRVVADATVKFRRYDDRRYVTFENVRERDS